MILRIVLSFLFFSFFLLMPVYGQELTYGISVLLSEEGAHEIVTINLPNTKDVSLEDYSFKLPGDARKLNKPDQYIIEL